MSRSHLRLGVVALLVLGLTVVLSTPAVAAIVTLGFVNISNNDIADAAIGEAQLFVDVDDLGNPAGTSVLFTFRNEGPLASSITDVYFDDGNTLVLLGPPVLIDADDGVGGDAGVDFSLLADPSNLPSANDAVPDFVTTTGFSADSDSPNVPANGVNPFESLGVEFDILSSFDVSDVLTDLGNGDLRIGIHVQAFAGDGSESFINTPPGPPGGGGGEIAEPASIAIWSLLGLGGLAMTWHRRRSRGAGRPWSPQARKAILKTIGR